MALHGFNHYINHTHLKSINKPLSPGHTDDTQTTHRCTHRHIDGKYNLKLVSQESGYKSRVRSTPLEYPDSRATSKRL